MTFVAWRVFLHAFVADRPGRSRPGYGTGVPMSVCTSAGDNARL
jgi:hypothetical protein